MGWGAAGSECWEGSVESKEREVCNKRATTTDRAAAAAAEAEHTRHEHPAQGGCRFAVVVDKPHPRGRPTSPPMNVVVDETDISSVSWVGGWMDPKFQDYWLVLSEQLNPFKAYMDHSQKQF